MSKSLDRLTLLETFVRIADSGSISAAARDLNLSQPSVSRQLVDLESRLNCQLIRRNTHSLALTDSGLDLLADARQMISGWETLEEKHFVSEEDIKGNIKIVAPVALGQSHLVRMACEFQKAHPNVNISWQLEDSVIRFSEVGCDIWIKVGDIPDDTLVVRELGKVERLLIASPDLTDRTSYRHPKDIGSIPLVALQPFEGRSIPLRNTQEKNYQFAGKAVMSTNNIFALKEAVKMGIGMAVLPRWFVETELQSGSLVDLLPSWRAPELKINVGYLPNPRQPQRLKLFLQSLKQYIATIAGVQSAA